MKTKTLKQWEESEIGNFYDFAKPGECMDEAIVDEFANSVPPVSFKSGYVQCGEPYSHQDDPETGRFRATFATFVKRDGNWIYCGHCFYGKIEEPKQ